MLPCFNVLPSSPSPPLRLVCQVHYSPYPASLPPDPHTCMVKSRGRGKGAEEGQPKGEAAHGNVLKSVVGLPLLPYLPTFLPVPGIDPTLLPFTPVCLSLVVCDFLLPLGSGSLGEHVGMFMCVMYVLLDFAGGAETIGVVTTASIFMEDPHEACGREAVRNSIIYRLTGRSGWYRSSS